MNLHRSRQPNRLDLSFGSQRLRSQIADGNTACDDEAHQDRPHHQGQSRAGVTRSPHAAFELIVEFDCERDQHLRQQR